MKRFFAYSAYTLGTLIFFLVILFPAEQAGTLAQRRLSTMLDKDVAITSVAPVGLFSFKVVKPGLRNDGEYLVRADSLVVEPSPLSLLRKLPEVEMTVKAYGGDVDCIIKASEGAKGPEGPYGGWLAFRDIKVDALEAVSRIPEPGLVSGALSGEFTFENLAQNIRNMEGEGDFTLSDGAMVMWSGLAAGLEIPYDEVHMMLSMKNRKITIKECVIKGDLVRGRFSGTIKMGRNISQSRVNVQGSLEPTRTFFDSGLGKLASKFLGKNKPGDSIPFTVTGTLADIQFMPK